MLPPKPWVNLTSGRNGKKETTVELISTVVIFIKSNKAPFSPLKIYLHLEGSLRELAQEYKFLT